MVLVSLSRKTDSNLILMNSRDYCDKSRKEGGKIKKQDRMKRQNKTQMAKFYNVRMLVYEDKNGLLTNDTEPFEVPQMGHM